MKKIRHFLGIFNYGITWLGLIRVSLGIACPIILIFVLYSNEKLISKIALTVILLITSFGCFIQGIPNLKEGYSHLKYRDAERLLYRVPVSSDDK